MRHKTSRMELSMIERYRKVNDNNQASREAVKLAAMMIRRLSKPTKRWLWAFEQIKKNRKNEIMRQTGEIVNMNAISFSIEK